MESILSTWVRKLGVTGTMLRRTSQPWQLNVICMHYSWAIVASLLPLGCKEHQIKVSNWRMWPRSTEETKKTSWKVVWNRVLRLNIFFIFKCVYKHTAMLAKSENSTQGSKCRGPVHVWRVHVLPALANFIPYSLLTSPFPLSPTSQADLVMMVAVTIVGNYYLLFLPFPFWQTPSSGGTYTIVQKRNMARM